MNLKKNWFTTVTLVLFELIAAYALWSGIADFADLKTNRFLWYGGILAVFAAVWALARLTSIFIARLKPPGILLDDGGKSRKRDRLIVAAVLLLAAAVRVWAIARFPVAVSMDYETYYNVAVLLSGGTLHSSGYSGYIAEFPHVFGYPYILSLLYRITGPSLQAGLYLNMAAGLASVYLIYKLARQLGGRLCGFIALCAAAFWPSQILYGTVLASEPVFTCLMLLGLRLFLYLWKYPVSTGNVEGSMYLCVLLGVLLALSSAVRPLAQILLIAVLLCLLPMTVRFDKNEKMLSGRLSRAACQGWFRALAVLLSFLVCSKLVSFSIENTIEYKLPGGGVSFGYNLMVGVNTDSRGAWNQQDADFFDAAFARTNSAEAAHKASLGVALERIKDDPAGILNLTLEKFKDLWANDDYGATWTTFFLDQQGNLTPERQQTVDTLNTVNDGFYLLSLFLSILFGLRLLRRKSFHPAHVLLLLVIGTAALHMLLECQNRYHYFVLPVFILLASLETRGRFSV